MRQRSHNDEPAEDDDGNADATDADDPDGGGVNHGDRPRTAADPASTTI
ncbi:hypothetical protein J2751_002263 [Halorubrum alkaliphilum]|uniref:Uncharacterized protein n=1 Tax=Halorubrum alkaliphilum TaxID=261290 RepID=A0A8T4GFC7_9EURY|nr:hypothetical protein [Halorubrum alkaliphilum]MBP1923224.1 hypothetical protein [Halorubrum alkaliphilum]